MFQTSFYLSQPDVRVENLYDSLFIVNIKLFYKNNDTYHRQEWSNMVDYAFRLHVAPYGDVSRMFIALECGHVLVI